MTRRLPLLCLAASALFALASVNVAAAQWAGAQRQGAPVTWDELEHTKWIADGRDDAPRKVYVFMDANCGYCTKFWAESRPWVDSGKVQLRYVMVAVIAPTSARKAAAVMTDPDPARRLARYERARATGVDSQDAVLEPALGIPPAVGLQLEQHEGLMIALGLRGTPGLVFHGLDGQMATRAGIATENLPLVLGSL